MERDKISSLKEIDIIYKNKKISLNSLDILAVKFIDEIFNDNNSKSHLTITLEDELIIIYILITIGISSYYKNLKNPENNILNNLKNGDHVCYKRKIYTFDGYSTIKSNVYIRLKEKSGLINNIPISNSYEITIYNGQSTRINKSKKLDIENKSNITKRLISEIMKVDISELNGVIEKSNLIVIKGKERILEIIDSIEIVFRNQNIPFTELFSTAYWSSADGEAQILKNSIKEDILFNITTNITTGMDLVINDNKIKNVIIIGEKSYRDSFETELRTLNYFCEIDKLVVFDTWESNDNYEYFLDDENGFTVWAFTKNFLLNNVNFFCENGFETASQVQKNLYYKANILVSRNVTLNVIKYAQEFNDRIKNIVKLLSRLSDYAENSDTILQFIKIGYHICNKVEETIIPLKYCNENNENIFKKLNMLEEKVLEFHVSRVEYKIMIEIITIIKELLEGLRIENKKFETIKELSKRNLKGLLLLKNKEEIISIQRYLMMNRINNLSYSLLEKDLDFSKYDYIILPFWYEYNNILNNNFIKELKIISYDREFYKYKWIFKRNEKLMKLLCQKNSLENYEGNEEDIEYDNVDIDDNEELKGEEKIKSILEENYIRLLTSSQYDSQNKYYGNGKVIAKRLIVLKDGNYAFLTENYISSCMNRDKNDIINKAIDEIEVGDELIFAINPKSEKGDIVKEIIEKLLEDREFSNLYGEFFKKNQLWKDALIEYMKENNLNEKDICKKFKIYGQSITPLAIGNWLNGNIIGPKDPNNIKIILEIIKNHDLKSEIENIIISCRQVRSIQIKIRKAIAKMIISSVVNIENEDNTIYRLVSDTIGNLSNYAYIGEVTEIRTVNKEISIQYINRINEGDDF